MRAAAQSSGKRAVDAQQPKAPVTGTGELKQVERQSLHVGVTFQSKDGENHDRLRNSGNERP
jgi:hypothetical protein